MKKLVKTIIILGVAITILLYAFKPQILKKIYPIKYKEYVEEAAKANEVDKLLIYSIIKAESGFKENVKSSSGAIGLMQIMLPTAQEIAKKIDIQNLTEEQLYEPKMNIIIGTKYFATLLETYDNNINLAIIAYNAGMGNVNKWIANGIINEDGTDVDNIPFEETKMYVKKILQNYEIYKEIY